MTETPKSVYGKARQTFVLLSTMKKLYLVRHAKSSWDDYSLMDEERPLNERGKRDAPVMAQLISDRHPGIQSLVTSPAKRALATAKVFRKTLKLGKKQMEKDARLYLATPSAILSVVKNLADELDQVAIFGHNPGMTDFLNRYSNGFVDNVPTCGVARIDFDVASWKDVEQGTMAFFYYPKMIGLL